MKLTKSGSLGVNYGPPEVIGTLFGIILIVVVIAFANNIAEKLTFHYMEERTSSSHPSSPFPLCSYYYWQRGADNKIYILKWDPLAEQEGGLRTTGNPATEPSGSWIYQFTHSVKQL